MVFLSISAKRFWLFVGLTALAVASAAVLFIIALGWLAPRSAKREFAIVRRSADVRQVQAWAMDMLRQFPGNTNESMVIVSNAPPFFRKIPAFGAVGPEVIVSGRGPEGQRCVKLLYFYGGWGHGQTIFAGPPTFVQATNSRSIRWVPGVYYTIW